jgi:ribose 5-phosphate isomerase B
MQLRVSIGSDHRGVALKARLVKSLRQAGYEVFDAGTDQIEPVDYPDIAHLVACAVRDGMAERGILLCGTGIGMAIVANKYRGVRAAVCHDAVMAEISRRHNDANVLCLPADLIGQRPIEDWVLHWLATDFEGGRHERRVHKIHALEAGPESHTL